MASVNESLQVCLYRGLVKDAQPFLSVAKNAFVNNPPASKYPNGIQMGAVEVYENVSYIIIIQGECGEIWNCAFSEEAFLMSAFLSW